MTFLTSPYRVVPASLPVQAGQSLGFSGTVSSGFSCATTTYAGWNTNANFYNMNFSPGFRFRLMRRGSGDPHYCRKDAFVPGLDFSIHNFVFSAPLVDADTSQPTQTVEGYVGIWYGTPRHLPDVTDGMFLQILSGAYTDQMYVTRGFVRIGGVEFSVALSGTPALSGQTAEVQWDSMTKTATFTIGSVTASVTASGTFAAAPGSAGVGAVGPLITSGIGGGANMQCQRISVTS